MGWTKQEKKEIAEHCKKIGWVETEPGLWEAPEGWRPPGYK